MYKLLYFLFLDYLDFFMSIYWELYSVIFTESTAVKHAVYVIVI